MAARHSPESPLQTVHERNFALRASECGRYDFADRAPSGWCVWLAELAATLRQIARWMRWIALALLGLLLGGAAIILLAGAAPRLAPMRLVYADCVPMAGGLLFCPDRAPIWLWDVVTVFAVTFAGAFITWIVLRFIILIIDFFCGRRSGRLLRPLDPGSEELRIEIGDEGLRLRGHRREIRLRWDAFDAETLFGDAYWGQPADPAGLQTAHTPGGEGVATTLDGFLADLHDFPRHGDAPRGTFRQATDARAGKDHVYLPLKRDPAARRVSKWRKKRLKRTNRLVNWDEYLPVPRSFFEGASSQIDWPDFVAACAWMIRLANPKRGEQ